jgi:hypothetical protein
MEHFVFIFDEIFLQTYLLNDCIFELLIVFFELLMMAWPSLMNSGRQAF